MNRLILYAASLALTAAAVTGASAQDKSLIAFGILEPVSAEDAQAQAQQWLKQTDQGTAANMQTFETIWKRKNRTVLDRLASTFVLGDKQAAKLLADVRNPSIPAPTELPKRISDDNAPKFYRANLTLAYARELVHRRVYEQALDALQQIKAEDVVDPAGYFFNRAVCEHGIIDKDNASKSINRLLGDVVLSPERYKTVSILMLMDMQTWKQTDLGDLARKMKNVKRRLQLARGGPKTQEMQKEIIRQLDRMINPPEPPRDPGDIEPGPPGNPDDYEPGPNNPNGRTIPTPRQRSTPGGPSGPGQVDQKRVRDLVTNWGQMSERERAEAIQSITDGMDAMNRQLIENYFRNIAKDSQD